MTNADTIWARMFISQSNWPTTTLLSDDGMDCSDADEPNHIMLYSFGNVQLQFVRSAPVGNVSNTRIELVRYCRRLWSRSVCVRLGVISETKVTEVVLGEDSVRFFCVCNVLLVEYASDSTSTQYCRRSALYKLLCMYMCVCMYRKSVMSNYLCTMYSRCHGKHRRSGGWSEANSSASSCVRVKNSSLLSYSCTH